jgi:hypothetical protein
MCPKASSAFFVIGVRTGRSMGVRILGIYSIILCRRRWLPANIARRTADRLDAFGIDTEPIERAGDESAVRQFIAQEGIGFQASVGGGDHLAVTVDRFPAALSAVEGLASEAKKLKSAHIIDGVSAVNGVPQA